MDDATQAVETAVWAAAEGWASADQLALLEADPATVAPDRRAAARRDRGPPRGRAPPPGPRARPGGRRLRGRAQPAGGRLRPAGPTGARGCRAGRSSRPARSGCRRRGRAARSSCGPPARPPSPPPTTSWPTGSRRSAARRSGWSQHRAVPLPTGPGAAALSIPVAEALGWLVAVGGGPGRRRASAPASAGSAGWPSPPCAWSRAAPSSPRCRAAKRPDGRTLDLAVRWVPALVDDAEVDRLAAAMPGPSPPSARPTPATVTLDVLGAVVDAIVTDAAGRLELPAPPPGHPHRGRRGRGGHHPARRLGVRGPGRGRAPRCPSASSAGPSRSPPPAGPGSSCSSTRPTGATPGSSRCSARAPRASCCPSRWPWPTAGHAAAGRRADPPRAAPARAAAGRRAAAGPGVPEPGRGVGADDRHRRLARGGRLRRPGAGAVPPQAVARPCACSPSPAATPWSAPTS